MVASDLGNQPDPAEQQIRNGQDQQKSINSLRLGDLGVAQAPAIAFALIVAEELFDGHPLAVMTAKLMGCAGLVAHQEPALIAFLGEILIHSSVA